jgi:hypothetical protein
MSKTLEEELFSQCFTMQDIWIRNQQGSNWLTSYSPKTYTFFDDTGRTEIHHYTLPLAQHLSSTTGQVNLESFQMNLTLPGDTGSFFQRQGRQVFKGNSQSTFGNRQQRNATDHYTRYYHHQAIRT